MFDKLLLRAIVVMLGVTQCGFLILLSGHNLHIEKRIEGLPKPQMITAGELEEIRGKVVTETKIEQIEKVSFIDSDQFECLVKNIYWEARNQPVSGKEGIAVVTLERSRREGWPNNICDVVKEKRKNKKGRWVCQFSWMCDGKSDEPTLESKEELAAWKRANEIAERALMGRVNPVIVGATHFHADYVNPPWASKLQRLAKIGDHIFYKEI